jgi:hypothetical protein
MSVNHPRCRPFLSLNSQQLVIQKVEQCINHACSYFEQNFRLPKISFNQRGKIAGCARLQINELRFNPILLSDNLDAFLEVVVPHEVCHLLVYKLFGKEVFYEYNVLYSILKYLNILLYSYLIIIFEYLVEIQIFFNLNE